MTDRAVLIPTTEGAVGGIVSQPEGEARAALLLLAGYGRPARSGINSFWTRLARTFAERGIAVLRVDYCREGETLPIGQGQGGLLWKRGLDLRLVEQASRWFQAQVGGMPLLLAGSCSGARLAIELAGTGPLACAGVFLVVPYIKDLDAVERRLEEAGAGEETVAEDPVGVDPLVVECFRSILPRIPGWILVGERDDTDVAGLRRALGPLASDLEVEVASGVALHELDQPRLQEEARSRLLSRLARARAVPDPVTAEVVR